MKKRITTLLLVLTILSGHAQTQHGDCAGEVRRIYATSSDEKANLEQFILMLYQK